MGEVKHTELPWIRNHNRINDAQGRKIAIIGGDARPLSEDTANAEIIVTAVNAYAADQEKIAALTAALTTARNIVFVAGGKQDTWKPELAKIDAALKLAGEK